MKPIPQEAIDALYERYQNVYGQPVARGFETAVPASSTDGSSKTPSVEPVETTDSGQCTPSVEEARSAVSKPRADVQDEYVAVS